MNSEKLKGHILILITNILFAVNMPISKYLLPTHGHCQLSVQF